MSFGIVVDASWIAYDDLTTINNKYKDFVIRVLCERFKKDPAELLKKIYFQRQSFTADMDPSTAPGSHILGYLPRYSSAQRLYFPLIGRFWLPTQQFRVGRRRECENQRGHSHEMKMLTKRMMDQVV